MTPSPIDRLATALLYEGYVLYPYRPSALKNRQRWTFGVLYPQAFCAEQYGSDAAMMQTECLVRDTAGAVLDVRVRFLHALVSNWISAGARLIPLGQTDSQRVLAALEQTAAETAKRALAAGLDDLGSATFRADLAGLRHETQYTRLFRS